MATSSPDTPQTGSIAGAIARFFKTRGATELPVDKRANGGNASPTRDDWGDFNYEPASMQFLMGGDWHKNRHRSLIYAKWQSMLQDPVITSALRLHVTASLGGHETKGEMVFIEATPDAKKNPKLKKMVEEAKRDLENIFNRIAPTVCMNGITFGDSYGRIYADERVGVRDVYVDELIYPPLVQPYERANTTVGYVLSTGARTPERLTVLQVARMKMPRMIYIPQDRVIDKAMKVMMRTDRLEELPAVPALAGGSFLDGSEATYDRFNAAWTGLVGQRVQASVNESIVTVQQQGMTRDQSRFQKNALTKMFERSNAYIKNVVAGGQPIFGRLWHFIPVSQEKQLARIEGQATAGLSAPFSTEDIMMHARFLSGALGVDLSMIGFADQLSGGLGDGGMFRASAQSAERSRAIRQALTAFFDHIIEVHILMKFGTSFEGMDKPWSVIYYSGISALEAERQKTKSDAANSFSLLTQILQSLKELGLPKEAVAHLLEKELGMDAEDAELLADGMEKAKAEADANGEGGGGGFGGGGGGVEDPPADDPPPPEPEDAASKAAKAIKAPRKPAAKEPI